MDKATNVTSFPSKGKKRGAEENYDEELFEEGIVTISQKMISFQMKMENQTKKKFMFEVHKKAASSSSPGLFNENQVAKKAKSFGVNMGPPGAEDPTKSQDFASFMNNGGSFKSNAVYQQPPKQQEEGKKEEIKRRASKERSGMIKMKTMNPDRSKKRIERQDTSKSILKKKMSVNFDKAELKKQVTFAEKKSIINYNPNSATVRNKRNRSQDLKE